MTNKLYNATQTDVPNLIAWNVDTQNDFIDEEGALSIANAQSIRPALQTLTNLFDRYKIKVINTKDDHDPSSKELSTTPNYLTTFPPHCMSGTEGAEFIKETNPQSPYTIDWRSQTYSQDAIATHRNIVLFKDHFDIFQGNSHVDDILHQIKPTAAIVYGVATNVCVNYAVLGLRQRGIDVYIVENAIKELPPPVPLEPTLDAWKKAGIKFTAAGNLECLLNSYQRK